MSRPSSTKNGGSTVTEPLGKTASLPADAFVQTRPPRFFGDWVDTEESQRLLQYQRRGLDEQLADMRKDFGALVPLIRLVRPLAAWFVTRSSAYVKENRRVGSG
ncbi:hypothetical protein [Mycobacterium sp. 1423905.2]|uniref:hypothetical protein n=1 Tax=Mycobacterium sp. 1423905.2 TaxID=1856859 RepID=UPI0007FBF0C7|nr:hypothetical protein [Mycobacterium sp. 1423905.2]OBJ58243.1 hypothetical protein A9W95_11880 [Mycobacterium sp. 1423905.2]